MKTENPKQAFDVGFVFVCASLFSLFGLFLCLLLLLLCPLLRYVKIQFLKRGPLDLSLCLYTP
jgi:hypothetical protein